jgi:RNA polymerase sigma-70 factor (ECF subfamily)
MMSWPFSKSEIAAFVPSEAGGKSVSPAIEREVIALFDDLREPLLRYLLSFPLAVADSEEIVQETFLALFQHLHRGKPRHNLKAWLFRVAHNLALKKRRGERREKQNVSHSELACEVYVADPAPNPESQFSSSQTRELLAAVVNALPEQDRRCLYLRAEGLRYREIAEILDLSISTVSVSLGRSLARINRATER